MKPSRNHDLSFEERTVVEQALSIVRYRLSQCEHEPLDCSKSAIRYASLKLSMEKREVFSGVSLDAQNKVINYREYFVGSLRSCAVYPREVVTACLEDNAAAIILMHNHPSGRLEASLADMDVTRVLQDSLKLIDVHVADHIIVAGGHCYSMAENGDPPF